MGEKWIGGKWEEVEERVRRLEWKGEMEKREERKRNIIIRGMEVKKNGWEGARERVEEIVKETGAVVKVEGIRRIGRKNEEKRKMLWVKFTNVEEKVEVMKEKRKLKNRREWISDDLMEKERRIKWLIKREAGRKSREGMRVRVGYMKLWLEGKLWVLDEIRDGLKGKREENRGESFLVGVTGKREEGEREEKRAGSWVKGKEIGERERVYKVGFWNVAGLEKKDKEFWERLGEWNVMFLSETWLQKKGWKKVKRWLPKGYI